MGWLSDLFAGDKPEAPTYTLPTWAQSLPGEALGELRSVLGQQLAEPSEYGIASEALQGLLNFQPDMTAYQLPMDEIQQALAAQQALQMQDYQKQLRPILASQGQLDSTYYANMLGDYLKNQQAQTYGTTADLLTQQANTNLQQQQTMNQWLPQFQASIAGQLSGLGGQRSGIDQFNMQIPYQTSNALQGWYGAGQTDANQTYNAAMVPYQQNMNEWNQNVAQGQQTMQMLGTLAAAGLTGGIGGLAAGTGFGAGAMQGLSGITPAMSQMMSSYQQPQMGNTRYNSNQTYAGWPGMSY